MSGQYLDYILNQTSLFDTISEMFHMPAYPGVEISNAKLTSFNK